MAFAGGTARADAGVQTWSVSINGVTGSMTCQGDGSCVMPYHATQSASGYGFSQNGSITFKFSGNQVSLQGSASGSAIGIQQSLGFSGSGVANAAYPDATTAQGQFTLTSTASLSGPYGTSQSVSIKEPWSASLTAGGPPPPALKAVTGGGNTQLVYGKDVSASTDTKVTTDQSSTATVDMGNNGADKIDLAPSTEVTVEPPPPAEPSSAPPTSINVPSPSETPAPAPGILFSLKQGIVHVIEEHKNWSIFTAAAVAAVRGTELIVSVSGNATTVQVLSGEVAVSDPAMKGTATLSAGQEITIAQGTVPAQSQVVATTHLNRFWLAASSPSVGLLPVVGGGVVIVAIAIAAVILWRKRRARPPTSSG